MRSEATTSRSPREIPRSSTGSAIYWRTPSTRAGAGHGEAAWDDDSVEATITDDGPGFASEIMDRIGEPYVTSRRSNLADSEDEPHGLGLGFFIAKTLLERSGAILSFENRRAPEQAPSSNCVGIEAISNGH